jgi:two-component system sensor histidine kinase TctE
MFLIPSLLILIVAAAALTYSVALYVATSSYDRSLLDPVLDMAANVHMEAGGPRLALLAQAQEALLYDHEDTLIFQIRAADDSVVAGAEELQVPPRMTPGEHQFFDGKYLGQPVRIAAMRSDSGFYIQVGETLNKRKRLILEILAVGLTPTLLIAGATLILAWTGVAHGLAPLARVRTELLRRTPQDLRPVDEASTPPEIAPAIAALNRLLGQLRESSALQQRFLADAAHQLRTPLAGLQMHLELLLRRDLALDIHDELEGMRAATLRASHLANQLLALAKAESITDQTDRIEPVDLVAVADRAVHEWVPQAIERGIDLGFVLEHANVLGNPALLGELLDNLIDNALRYTPADGTVTVRCGSADGQSYLSVEDTGPGIPEWAHARVFERFFRLQGTPGDGAGLGLAIVKEVAQKHGAILRIENQQDHGTRIVVRFPPASVTGS